MNVQAGSRDDVGAYGFPPSESRRSHGHGRHDNARRPPAQSSCAANFVAEHLHDGYEGGWLHCDMAGPSTADERGTGYGVGLTLALLGVDGFRDASE